MSACVCCAGTMRRAVQWSRSRQTIKSSSGRWRQRSRRSTGEGLALIASEGGQAARLTEHTPFRLGLLRYRRRVHLTLLMCALRECRNFEKAAHEVLAASKRHQMHAKISCLSFIRRKPLDELSVSCTAQCDVAAQICARHHPADRHLENTPSSHDRCCTMTDA
jgi:hypothetical protein